MKRLLIFVLFGMSLIFFCCKDKEEIIRKVDPELKEWGLYQKGTWWVYQEVNTKIIDSFWVDSIQNLELEGNGLTTKWEEIQTIVKSGNSTSNDFAIILGGLSTIVKLETFEQFSSENAELCHILDVPIKKGRRFPSCDAFKWAELDTIYDNLKLGSIEFKNIARVYDMCNPAFMNQPTYFYLVKNIGIVRKEFPDNNQIWNLIRFNIIQ